MPNKEYDQGSEAKHISVLYCQDAPEQIWLIWDAWNCGHSTAGTFASEHNNLASEYHNFPRGPLESFVQNKTNKSPFLGSSTASVQGKRNSPLGLTLCISVIAGHIYLPQRLHNQGEKSKGEWDREVLSFFVKNVRQGNSPDPTCRA